MNQRLIIILELIVAFGLFFWYVQPTYTGSIQILHAKIASEQMVSRTMQKYSQEETRLEEKKNSMSQISIMRLSKMVPTTNGTAHFLFSINALASRSGFALNKFNIKNQNNNPQQNVSGRKQNLYKTFTLDVSGEGTYGAFRQFLGGIERSLRIIDVTSLSIRTNVSSTGKNINLYDYSLTLQIYRLPSAL